MLYNTDYTNCKVVIRNETTGETIAQTKILEYNKRQLSIFVDAYEFLSELEQKRLSLLIFSDDSIYLFGGVARKSFSPRRTEISIFQGKEHEDREAKRYPIRIPATIKSIFYAEDNETLEVDLNIQVINLSTHGILIETDSEDIEINAVFTVNIDIAGSPTFIKCLVVRCANNEDSSSSNSQSYGCKFISIVNT